MSRAAKLELLNALEAKLALRARESLTEFARYIPIPGVPLRDDDECEEFYPASVEPAAHHRLMLSVLQGIADGKIRRAMIMLPPGTAKSTWCSVVFPAWYMGRHPRANIIATSYASDLARKFGRRCRSIIKSQEYAATFGIGLTGDNAAADDWSLTNGSTYMAGGVLAGITGNRADGLIIDDPIKGREEADSKVIRDKVWEAYKSDLRSRAKPKLWILLVTTRWHEDDPAGRILPEDYDGRSGIVTARDGEDWFVVNLPAQCERDDDPVGRKVGDWLWTEWFPPSFWEQERRSQGPRNWSALYQQRPSPETGTYFSAEWVRWYDRAPPRETLRIYAASDYAVTEDGGDWTVHGIVGVDPDDNLFILDWWRAQTTPDVWVDAVLAMTRQWHPMEWGEEGGQIRGSVGPFLVKRLREERVPLYRRQFPSVLDKAIRAQSFRGRMAMGQVYFPRNAPWSADLISELMSFPNGRNDDQVDVCGMFGRMLDRMATGRPLPKAPEPMQGLEGVTLDRMWKEVDKQKGASWRI